MTRRRLFHPAPRHTAKSLLRGGKYLPPLHCNAFIAGAMILYIGRARRAKAPFWRRKTSKKARLMTATRTETDTFGPIEVQADRYWGAQAQRSLGNFKIGWEKPQPAPTWRWPASTPRSATPSSPPRRKSSTAS
jgi:fumarate hydratase, class II